ncbi:Holliday junction DNA helicase RuvA [Pontimonas salivibrio]|uniref:Holliday junction branch migration complex subunit RuvA n=1 Tax=Pontimonas salivibrio TaxID=1159327 RepID=A0A2L2BQZ9_9MICO|nr:Holliday junction branch migration protein RuvA [Pontimonas salivibrio]AVG24090.1 Holliday junction DNA helicase RuvA [Pontimonas salivibrio]
MISQLRGVVALVDGSRVVIDIHGVGLSVSVPERTASVLRAGEDTLLHTSMIVREDDMSLTGFALAEERDLFDQLRSVGGVGPKSALGVLQHYTAEEIASAIASEDDATFRQVSGIGPKTAKLIVLTLHGKLTAPPVGAGKGAVDTSVSGADQAAIVQALVGLGWSERVAKKGVSDMLESLGEGETPSVSDLVRRALQLLGPQTSREGNR